MTWVEQAACKEVGPGPWDSDDETANSYREARRVCRVCPVAAECLEWALTNDERFGMWGGMTPAERRGLGNEMDHAARRAEANRVMERRHRAEMVVAEIREHIDHGAGIEGYAREHGIKLNTAEKRLSVARRVLGAR
jgi:WhiB family redox-sensing transcriptional regulator